MQVENFYLYRILYVTVKLTELCLNKNCIGFDIISDKEKTYIEKISALKKRIENSQEQADSINYLLITANGNTDWETYPGTCQICECSGTYYGETAYVQEFDINHKHLTSK